MNFQAMKYELTSFNRINHGRQIASYSPSFTSKSSINSIMAKYVKMVFLNITLPNNYQFKLANKVPLRCSDFGSRKPHLISA